MSFHLRFNESKDGVLLTLLCVGLLFSQTVAAQSSGPSMEEIQKAAKRQSKEEEKKEQNSSRRSRAFTPRSSNHYTLEDLEILERNQNYTEFLEHARDIRPSQRKKPWKEMVHNMATSYIDFALEREEFNQKTFSRIYELSSWATLRGDDYFHYKWQKYGRQSVEACLKQEENLNASIREKCDDRLDQLWESTTPRPEFALDVAELKKKTQPQKDLWKYYRHTTQSEVAVFHCQRADVQEQIFKQIHERAEKQSLHGEKLKDSMMKVMNRECWDQLVSELKRIMRGPKPQQMSAFKALESMGELSTREKDIYLVNYLLSNPRIGRLFNKAWARLQKLGDSVERRETVLSHLKTQDPLPDQVFGIGQHDKKAGILDHFAKNFPEYLDYYGKTCLDYLQGIKKFPRGNPTMECRELFRAQKKENGKDWIHQGLRIRYSSLRKLNKFKGE